MRNEDKRCEEILFSLVSAYIFSGKAVGSSTLADRLENKFSPATIRNVMGDLEKAGLLTHRHTSGGRIPTDVGMRYYVDRLLKLEPLSEVKISNIKARYKGLSYNVSNILMETSKVLSGLSSYAGLVVSPKIADIVVKHMEFIPLSRNKVLGIFVGRDGIVENRIIKIEKELTYSNLEKINNYCNRVFYGLTLSGAKDKVAKEIIQVQAECDEIISSALSLSQKMFLDLEKTELFVEGMSQLLGSPDFARLDRVTSLMDLLEEKDELISLLNNALNSEAVNIFIGSESGYDAISDCSVVSAPYKKGGSIFGTLGVIGPKRMDYSKVIPIVDYTADLIGDFLNGDESYDA